MILNHTKSSSLFFRIGSFTFQLFDLSESIINSFYIKRTTRLLIGSYFTLSSNNLPVLLFQHSDKNEMTKHCVHKSIIVQKDGKMVQSIIQTNHIFLPAPKLMNNTVIQILPQIRHKIHFSIQK